MVKSFSKWFIVLVSLGVVMVGCDKTTEPGGTAPVIPVLQFSTPAQPGPSDTSSCRWNAYYLAQASNAFGQLSAIFGALPPTQDGNTWTWQYPIEGLTITLKATKTDNGFSWTVTLNGTDEDVQYNNWVAMRGETNADGTRGTWTIYEENSTVREAEFSWERSSTNVLTGTLIEYSSGTPETKIVHVSNPDNSGEITMYYYSSGAWVQGFHATWAPGAPAVCD